MRSTLENSLLSSLTFSTKAVLSEAPAQSKILDNDDNIFPGQTEQGGQLNLQHFFSKLMNGLNKPGRCFQPSLMFQGKIWSLS